MSALCRCGCQLPARGNSQYASDACRTRYFDSFHPRLDLSGLDIEARKRAERLVAEAVRAAREGCERATVDAHHPVEHERDTRPSCRVRLDAETWLDLDALVEAECFGATRSEVVRRLVRRAFEVDLLEDARRKTA